MLEVVSLLTKTLRKMARKLAWLGHVPRLLKSDLLVCILCGKKMCFSGLKQGLRLAELLVCHGHLAQMKFAVKRGRREDPSVAR